MPWMIVVILLTLLDKLSSEVACIQLADIYWNITNPIFRIDNTDHIIDVNKGNVPFEYDQVNIICPVYTHGTKDEEEERYIIYNVSKEEYDSCRITNPSPRIISICDNPRKVMYFTITFRSFTPQPGGLEFLPGHDYYFISTSTGGEDGLHQLVGGRCATHNMKVIFKVCCSPSKAPAGTNTISQPSVAPNASALAVSTVEPKNSHITFTSKPNHLPRPLPTTPSSYPKWIRPVYPTRPSPIKPYEVPVEDEMAKEPSQNTVDRDKLPNKARSKNEGFTNSSHTQRPCTPELLLTLAILLLLTLFTR